LSPSGVPYADYTAYQPVNLPSTVPVSNISTIKDPNHWQPLTYFNGTAFITQVFVGAQWNKVIPFAMTSPDQFLPFVSHLGPALYGSYEYTRQARELIDFAANLTEEQKMIAEYWATGPHSELPPGHWDLFGQFVSARDHHSLDQDVKMFFALTNAVFDAVLRRGMRSASLIQCGQSLQFHICSMGSRFARGAAPEKEQSRWMARSGFRISPVLSPLHPFLNTFPGTARSARLERSSLRSSPAVSVSEIQ